jgi:hypothetical protein
MPKSWLEPAAHLDGPAGYAHLVSGGRIMKNARFSPRIVHIPPMTSASKAIENAELVETVFGCWPSFHDAEIQSIVITRDCDSGAQMDVTIHHWKLTSAVDSKGFYVLKLHTLTTLRFFNVSELSLGGFNHQNVLLDMEISEIAEPPLERCFSVSMPAAYGCEASFRCERIRVISSAPYTKHNA